MPSMEPKWLKSNRAATETLNPRLLLLDHGLPLSLSLPDGEAVDLGLDLGSPLPHVVLDVEDKRLLAEVCIYNLPRGLKPHSGV